jgi:hypothetical protein
MDGTDPESSEAMGFAALTSQEAPYPPLDTHEVYRETEKGA